MVAERESGPRGADRQKKKRSRTLPLAALFMLAALAIPPGTPGPLAATGLFGSAPGLRAETAVSAEAFMATTVLVGPDGVSSFVAPGGNGDSCGVRLFLDHAAGGAFRASAACTLSASGALTLDRAYGRARFPWVIPDSSLRVTAGKAPLSWGKGFAFNAGDPVFGPVPQISSPGEGAYRYAADWMAVTYLPLGAFSFAELVYLPPVGSAHNRAGGRLVLAPGLSLLQSVEASYLFEEGPEQSACLSLDGSLWADWYAAASARFGRAEAALPQNAEWAISFGVFRLFRPLKSLPLAVRAEGLAFPAENRCLWYPSVRAGLSDTLSLGVQGFFASGDSLEAISSRTGITAASAPAFSALAALPGLDSRSAVVTLSLDFRPIDEIALSATATRRCEKGDWLAGETVIGFRLTTSF